jgi:hypothetical protein
MGFAPRAILAPGSRVKGVATRGQWVKITGPRELTGWIYGKLLASP